MKVFYIKEGLEAIGSLDEDRLIKEYPYHKVRVTDITSFKGALKWAH